MSEEHDRRLFEEAIRAYRYDAVIRNVFADWLEERGYDDEAAIQRSWTLAKQQAEDWLTEYAQEHGLSYQDLIGAADSFLGTHNSDPLNDELTNVLFDPDRWDEFWQRFATATGRSLESWTGTLFGQMYFYWGDPGDPCGMCPWEENDYEEPDDPYGDDFYNDQGW